MKRFFETRKRWEARRHRSGAKSVGTILFAMSMGATIDEAEAVAAKRHPAKDEDRRNGAFFEGRDRRWFEEGQRDAADGCYRGHLYRKHSYDLGWRELVEARSGKGWTNQQLTDEAKRNAWAKDPDRSAAVDKEEMSMEKTSVELFAEIEAINELRKGA